MILIQLQLGRAAEAAELGAPGEDAVVLRHSSHSSLPVSPRFPSPRPGRAVARSHLAGGGGAAEDAQVNHEPGQRQAQRLLPLHIPAGLQRRGDVQGLAVPEVLRGRCLLTLLLVARAVAVEGAGGPRQGVLAGRGME